MVVGYLLPFDPYLPHTEFSGTPFSLALFCPHFLHTEILGMLISRRIRVNVREINFGVSGKDGVCTVQ